MILSTSDTKFTSDGSPATSSEPLAHTAFTYLLIALFCLLFGVIYEHFSHEVYSNYMIYAFAFPLVGGTIPFLTLSLAKVHPTPGCFCSKLYHCGIATLTVGSIIEGVLDIYGTTNSLTTVYWLVGFLLIITAICLYAYEYFSSKK